MKIFSLREDLTTNHKENLLLAYSIINNTTLFKPECSIANRNAKEKPKEGFIFGKDDFISYGHDYGIPSWDEFYNAHKNDEDFGFLCVAGCDENDTTRITISALPEEAKEGLEEHKGIIVSVTETLGKKKVQSIVDNIIDLYEQYKSIYL